MGLGETCTYVTFHEKTKHNALNIIFEFVNYNLTAPANLKSLFCTVAEI